MIYRHGIYAQRYVSSGGVLIPGDGTTTWDSTSGVITSLGKIMPDDSSLGWMTHYGSFGTVPASTDFVFEFKVEQRVGSTQWNLLVGISSGDTNGNFLDMDTCFYIVNNTGYPYLLRIYEGGTKVQDYGNNQWSLSDTFKIERVGTVLKFYQNGTLKYTSGMTSTSVIKGNFSSYRELGAKEIQITY